VTRGLAIEGPLHSGQSKGGEAQFESNIIPKKANIINGLKHFFLGLVYQYGRGIICRYHFDDFLISKLVLYPHRLEFLYSRVYIPIALRITVDKAE
jgi:hypothetical protein